MSRRSSEQSQSSPELSDDELIAHTKQIIAETKEFVYIVLILVFFGWLILLFYIVAIINNIINFYTSENKDLHSLNEFGQIFHEHFIRFYVPKLQLLHRCIKYLIVKLLRALYEFYLFLILYFEQ